MSIESGLKGVFRHVSAGLGVNRLERHIVDAKLLAGRALVNQMKARGTGGVSLRDAEFKVFSQFGDDGIIQYLIHHLAVPQEQESFIEFGVENYLEANTRFLLLNNNWRGLIIDGSKAYMEHVRREDIYWRHDLTAVAAFIDRDNINDLFRDHGYSGEIGLLSIDIDGNDYWVWERIDVVAPLIVVIEYNSVFGPQHAVTIPYDASFQRTKAHYSNLYWGTSLGALNRLAGRKGYSFVGCNNAGNNAYFVRSDRLGSIKSVSVEEGYRPSRFRESRDAAGRLSLLSGIDRLRAIRDMKVYDVERDALHTISELYGI